MTCQIFKGFASFATATRQGATWDGRLSTRQAWTDGLSKMLEPKAIPFVAARMAQQNARLGRFGDYGRGGKKVWHYRN